MNDSEMTSTELFTEIVTVLTKEYFIRATDSVMSKQPKDWRPYVDLSFKLREIFTNRIIAKDTFINEIVASLFSRQLLQFCDMVVEIYVDHIFSKEISEELEVAKKLYYSSLPRLTDQMSLDHFNNAMESSSNKDLTKEDSIDYVNKSIYEMGQARTQYLSSLQAIENKLQKSAYLHIAIYIGKLMELYAKCESPLEKTFLIGLMTYTEYIDVWLDGRFSNQLKAENYRLDFAVQDPELGIKLNIELDGHNYHERTEEQAVSDRSRDRILSLQGWQVIRFHRKEIDTDLKSCIEQVVAMLRSSKSSSGLNWPNKTHYTA